MRRFWWMGAVALAIAFVVGWASYWSTRVYTDPTRAAEKAVRRDIEAALPRGSSRNDVEAWLASQGLRGQELRERSANRFAGIAAESTSTSDNWLGWRQELYMEFYFNSDGEFIGEFVRFRNITS